MAVFVRAVELGGFSPAARDLHMSPSAISKLVTRLEARLGARLVNRSTRRFRLTPEGQSFYHRCVRILSDIDEAEREAGAGAAPRGRVRVNANVPFGRHCLLPLVSGFLERYPDVALEITLSDAVVDLLEERTDVAIRVGPMRASRLVARKLGESRMAIVAAPSYLERHGTPRTVAELDRHNRIGFSFERLEEGWPLLEADVIRRIPVSGNVLVGDGESARQLALAGVGLVRLGHFHIGADLREGRLRRVLDDLNPGDAEEIHAVFVGQGGHLPARVRAFVDYLASAIGT